MGYTTLNKDEKEEEKKVLILFTPTFLPFGQEVSLAQRTRSIPICYYISIFINIQAKRIRIFQMIGFINLWLSICITTATS